MPDETDDRIIETARIINQLPVSNVKLHNLHVLTNTPLEKMYDNGEFIPDELDVYANKIILFLRYLSPAVAVQRLAAIASRWDELVAPKWTGQKMAPLDYIENKMKVSDVIQGDLYDRNQKPEMNITPLVF